MYMTNRWWEKCVICNRFFLLSLVNWVPSQGFWKYQMRLSLPLFVSHPLRVLLGASKSLKILPIKRIEVGLIFTLQLDHLTMGIKQACLFSIILWTDIFHPIYGLLWLDYRLDAINICSRNVEWDQWVSKLGTLLPCIWLL